MIRPLLWLPLAVLSVAPALAQDASLEKQAQKLHALAGGDWCEPVEDGFVPEDAYTEWTFSYVPIYNDDEAEEVTVIRIFCMSGAYNMTHAWYWHRQFEGLMPLSLAEPVFDTKYENDDSFEGELLGVTVTGMSATSILVNSSFNPETLTISSASAWRGIGDASSSGTWVFEEGAFVLRRFDVDASYDGEMNPETIVEYE